LHGSDGCDYIRVGSAAADIAAHRFANRAVALFERLVQQPGGRHDLAGRAVAALKSVTLDEGGLHRVKSIAVGQSLDCDYSIAFVHHGQRRQEFMRCPLIRTVQAPHWP